MPPKVVEYGKDFARTVRSANARYVSVTNSIPRKYWNDLTELGKKYQQDGDLDGVIAVKKEIQRYQNAKSVEPDPFEPIPEMPTDVIVDAPAALRTLQEQYVMNFSAAVDDKKAGLDAAREKFLLQLSELEKSYTRAGKIDEAIAVRQAKGQLASILESGDFSQLPGMDAVLPASESSVESRSDSAGSALDNWQKWKYIGNYPFSPDVLRFRHPDIPEQMGVTYDANKGRARFLGSCQNATVQAGSTLCNWTGRAMEWEVPGIDDLATDLRVSVANPSLGESGPHFVIAVLLNGVRAKARTLDIPLTNRESLVRIVRDKRNSNRFALYWPIARISQTFEVPDDVKVTIIMGATLHNIGDTCDATVYFNRSIE